MLSQIGIPGYLIEKPTVTWLSLFVCWWSGALVLTWHQAIVLCSQNLNTIPRWSNYPEYFWEPHWLSIRLLEISKVTLTGVQFFSDTLYHSLVNPWKWALSLLENFYSVIYNHYCYHWKIDILQKSKIFPPLLPFSESVIVCYLTKFCMTITEMLLMRWDVHNCDYRAVTRCKYSLN